jgi:hypothetical protein
MDDGPSKDHQRWNRKIARANGRLSEKMTVSEGNNIGCYGHYFLDSKEASSEGTTVVFTFDDWTGSSNHRRVMLSRLSPLNALGKRSRVNLNPKYADESTDSDDASGSASDSVTEDELEEAEDSTVNTASVSVHTNQRVSINAEDIANLGTMRTQAKDKRRIEEETPSTPLWLDAQVSRLNALALNDTKQLKLANEAYKGLWDSLEWTGIEHNDIYLCAVRLPQTHDSNMKYVSNSTMSHKEADPLDFFRTSLPLSDLNMLASESNNYAEQNNYWLQATFRGKQRKRKTPAKKSNTTHAEITAHDIELVIGMLLSASLCNKGDIKRHWEDINPASFNQRSFPRFNRFMSYARFQFIRRAVHAVDNTVIVDRIAEGEQLSPSQRKLGDVLKIVSGRWTEAYGGLRQYISFDEGMIKFQGSASFKVSLPKPISKGLRSYIACHGSTKIPIGFVFDDGSNRSNLGLAASMINEKIFKSGDIAVTDRAFTNGAWVLKCLGNNVGCIGTSTSRFIPGRARELLQQKLADIVAADTDRKQHRRRVKTERGDFATVITCGGRIAISAIHDNGKNPFYLIQTAGTTKLGIIDRQVGDQVNHFWSVQAQNDYNYEMNGVDVFDSFVNKRYTGISSIRRSYRWNEKALFGLIDMSVAYAFLVYRQQTTGTPVAYPHFVEQLSDRLLGFGGEIENRTSPRLRNKKRKYIDARDHCMMENQKKVIKTGAHKGIHETVRKVCGICHKRSTYTCKCGVHLHVPCHEEHVDKLNSQ